MEYEGSPEFERFYSRMIRERYLELLEQKDIEISECAGIDPTTPKGLGKMVGTMYCLSK